MATPKAMYVCPMHPEVRQDHPGHCPKCGGMELVRESEVPKATFTHSGSDSSYRPLLIIIGLIAVATLALTINDWRSANLELTATMRYFLAGFFLVFAGFKLLDIKGFATGYATYDLLAKRWFGYGYIYPFLELGLGLAYLTNIMPLWTNWATFILLSFSGIGVASKLLKHERFQCACLGTFLKVPLTKVTLIEDFGMAAMALIMLLL
jgi:hypothetical protein